MNNNERTLRNQVLALAAVTQAATLVDKLARTGIDDTEAFSTLVHGLLETRPATSESVFIDRQHLRLGLEVLHHLLQQSQSDSRYHYSEILRYTLSMIHLERKLSSNSEMLGSISKRLEQVERQIGHFQAMDTDNQPYSDRVLANIASLYIDTLSTFRFRIQVNGNPRHLQQELVINKVRCLLLCGIRAAVLWKQVGGSRFSILFNRKKHILMTAELLA
jgi:high frequency lysogenization protein